MRPDVTYVAFITSCMPYRRSNASRKTRKNGWKLRTRPTGKPSRKPRKLRNKTTASGFGCAGGKLRKQRQTLSVLVCNAFRKGKC